MQVKIIFVFIICVLAYILGTAQIISVNDKGEEIISYKDGSWRYLDPSDPEDQALIRKNLKKTTGNNTAQDEQLAQKQAIVNANRALAELEKAEKAEKEATLNRIFVEEDLDALRNDPESSALDVVELEEKLKLEKARENIAKNKRKQLAKDAVAMEKMVDMSIVERQKYKAKINGKKQGKKTKLANTNPNRPKRTKADKQNNTPKLRNEETYTTAVEPTVGIQNKSSSPFSTGVSFLPIQNAYENPPKTECKFSFEGADEFTGKSRWELESSPLFSYTDDRLRTHLKGKEYIECQGHLSALSGGLKFLTLDITIASEMAQREFGMLAKGSSLIIKFINGKTATIYNKKTNQGTVIPAENKVEYQGLYLIGPDALKALAKYEVDKIRVIWSTGFEEYDVYEVDFFIDQLKCLSKKSKK